MLLVGVAYWAGWTKILPRVGGYKVVVERQVLDDGAEAVRFRKVYKSEEGAL